MKEKSTIFQLCQSAFEEGKDNGVIGYLEYSDAMKDDEGPFDQPAMAEGEVAASADAFDTILMLLLKQKGPALLGLRVKGIKSGFPLGPIWDISKTSKLEIVYFNFILLDQPADDEANDESADPAAAIRRIEERLTQIEKLIQQGIRIRLFG